MPYHTVKLSASELSSSAIILGEELRGIPEEILDMAEIILEIPMLGKKESLNVSVAFGIVAFSLVYGAKK